MDSWDFTEPHKEMRDDLVLAITEVINTGTWTKKDIPTLTTVREGLKTYGYPEQSDQVEAKISGM